MMVVVMFFWLAMRDVASNRLLKHAETSPWKKRSAGVSAQPRRRHLFPDKAGDILRSVCRSWECVRACPRR